MHAVFSDFSFTIKYSINGKRNHLYNLRYIIYYADENVVGKMLITYIHMYVNCCRKKNYLCFFLIFVIYSFQTMKIILDT